MDTFDSWYFAPRTSHENRVQNVAESLSLSLEEASQLKTEVEDRARATVSMTTQEESSLRLQVLCQAVLLAWLRDREIVDALARRWAELGEPVPEALSLDVEAAVMRDAAALVRVHQERRGHVRQVNRARFKTCLRKGARKMQVFPEALPAALRYADRRTLRIKWDSPQNKEKLRALVERRARWAFDASVPQIDYAWLLKIVDDFLLLLRLEPGFSPLWQTCLGYTRNTDQALDLFQSTVLQLIEEPQRYEPGTDLYAFLNKSARNLFLSKLRRHHEQSLDELLDEEGTFGLQERLGSRALDPQEILTSLGSQRLAFVELLNQAQVGRKVVGSQVREVVLVPDVHRGGFCEVPGLSKRDLDVFKRLLAPLIDSKPNKEAVLKKEIAAEFGEKPPMISNTIKTLEAAYTKFYELDEPLQVRKRGGS